MNDSVTSFEFRPYTDDELVAFDALQRYVFGNTEPVPESGPETTLQPEWSQCAFHDGRIVASSAAYPFVVRMNGPAVTMHGVTAVGTDPAYRRRGLVRRMITDLLHRARDEGHAGSILLASMGAIYQRFGYGLASDDVGYEFDPRNAAFQFDVPITGTTRRVPIDEALPIVKHVFREYVKDKNMMALRHDVTWGLLLGDNAKSKPYFVVHYNDANEPVAYCLYELAELNRNDFGPWQTLRILDFYHSDIIGYRAIWQYLCSHDLVGKVVWGSVPGDDPAPNLLLEPRCLNRKVSDGLWLRVVDLPRMLTGRGYDTDGECVVEMVDDDLCDWNNGRYLLTISNGKAEVQPTNQDVDVTLGPQGMATLLAGYASVTRLESVGRAEVRDAQRLGKLDALFATRFRPHLSFGF